MQAQLASAKEAKLSTSLIAIPFYDETGETHVHVAFDWPKNFLDRDSSVIGVLGIVLKSDGSLASRFSDLFESAEKPHWFAGMYENPHLRHVLTRYERQLSLSPGEYRVRTIVSDGTRFGSAEVPLTVIGYDGRELAMSAVSLCKQISDASAYSLKTPPKLAGAWTADVPNYVRLISNDFEFKPTANTNFKTGENLYTYFEVYEPLLQEQTPATLEIQMRVVDLKTGETKSDSQPISATPYIKPGNRVIPIGRGIEIRKLPKGAYRLSIRATDSTGKSTAWHTVDFTVD
jgi:hypothetical protein